MLGVTEVTIFAADPSEDDELTLLLEGEAVFEGDISLPFSAEYYVNDEDLDMIAFDDDMDDLVESYDDESLKDTIIESTIEFLKE